MYEKNAQLLRAPHRALHLHHLWPGREHKKTLEEMSIQIFLEQVPLKILLGLRRDERGGGGEEEKC